MQGIRRLYPCQYLHECLPQLNGRVGPVNVEDPLSLSNPDVMVIMAPGEDPGTRSRMF